MEAPRLVFAPFGDPVSVTDPVSGTDG